MSARRKGAAKRQPASPKKSTPDTGSPAIPRQKSSALVCARNALDECVGAICLVEVTLHSLEWQEIASPEQEVLKRALKAIWTAHDWIDDLAFKDLEVEGSDREDEP